MTRLFPILCLVLAGPLQAAQLTLTWQDNSDNETGFIIQRTEDQQTWAEIGRVGVDVETYVDTAILYNVDYWYRVCAYNAAGQSGWTNIVNGKDLPDPLPETYDKYRFRAKRESMIRKRMLL